MRLDDFYDLDKFISDKKMFSDDVVSLYEFIAKFRYKNLFKNPELLNLSDALLGPPMSLVEHHMDQD